MQVPVAITFRGMSPSAALESAITGWTTCLERVYDRVHSCHVWVEAPSRNDRRQRRFHVRILVSVPGRSIVVAPEEIGGHADAFHAVADAFLAARRQLQDFAQIRRGDVKHHAA
jgi:hypothetical protein